MVYHSQTLQNNMPPYSLIDLTDRPGALEQSLGGAKAREAQQVLFNTIFIERGDSMIAGKPHRLGTLVVDPQS